jgi:hypothetical protein
MTHQVGNLSKGERLSSALLGGALSLLAYRSRNTAARLLTGSAALGLLSRALAGHCAVKAVLKGHASWREGLTDQWRALSRDTKRVREGLRGSPLHAKKTQAVDESINESFPASDPPASRLPDDPPVNADAKWAAARAAAGKE